MARAARLARVLAGRGAGPESVVAVVLDRSAELVAALLGVLKAGAAYLPLDPGYPAERLAFMLADAGAGGGADDAAALAGLPGGPGAGGAVDDPGLAAAVAGGGRLPVTRAGRRAAGHLAYVIYTSGSTGAPKGVVVAHAGLANRLAWMQAAFGLGGG